MKLILKSRIRKEHSGQEGVTPDNKLAYFKKLILEHLEKAGNDDEEQPLKKAGMPVGTIREWKGQKYVKVAPGKWRPKYDGESRGAKMAISAIKKKVDNAKTAQELMNIVMENRDRFSDAQGHPLPFVQELSKYVSAHGDKIEEESAREEEKAKPEKTQKVVLRKKAKQAEKTQAVSADEEKPESDKKDGGGEDIAETRNTEGKKPRKRADGIDVAITSMDGTDIKRTGKNTAVITKFKNSNRELTEAEAYYISRELGRSLYRTTFSDGKIMIEYIDVDDEPEESEEEKAKKKAYEEFKEQRNKIAERNQKKYGLPIDNLEEDQPKSVYDKEIKDYHTFDFQSYKLTGKDKNGSMRFYWKGVMDGEIIPGFFKDSDKMRDAAYKFAEKKIKREKSEEEKRRNRSDAMKENKNAKKGDREADGESGEGGMSEKTPEESQTSPEKPGTFDAIRDKYQSAKAVDGEEDEIAVGKDVVSGKWRLVEADTPTASHDERTFNKTKGFPTTGDGSTINDRDYEKDRSAQEIVIDIGMDYDMRALSFDSPVVVTKDGIVISGNNRTMSSKIAARKGTDTKYIEALRKKAKKFGFTPEDVSKFKNPRVIFETDENEGYSTALFAKFNSDDKKAMNPIEEAVKVSKIITQETIEAIALKISDFETLGDLYADKKAPYEIFNKLISAGVVGKNQLPKYYTEQTGITGDGKNFIETALLGSVLTENNIRGLNREGCKSIRQKLVRAITPLVENKGMDGYSVTKELNEAVDVAMQAALLKDKFRNVSEFAQQKNMFEKLDPLAIEFAKKLEGTQKAFAEFMQTMNGGLKFAANGEADVFCGGVETREEILERFLAMKKSLHNVLDFFRDMRWGDGRFVKKPVEILRDGRKITAMRWAREGNVEKSLTYSGHKLQDRCRIHGMDISIENKKGSVRSGTDKDGHDWHTVVGYSYGYIRGTVGRDKDHLDVYVGPNPESERVFVVHQNDPTTGVYDEDKVMLGFSSPKEAREAYLKQYDRPGFFGDIVEMDIDTFKEKVFSESQKGRKVG